MGITEIAYEYKRRLHATLQILEENTSPTPAPRILRHFPTVPWSTVWRNLHTCGLADTELSTWYQVVHDIVPTRQRLAAHRIVAAVQCVLCGGVDTLLHRLVQCVAGAVLWRWTRGRLARFLRVEHTAILEEWLLRPAYHFWPPTKNAAVTWILAQFVCYRLHTQRRQSLSDYLDFLRRTRWKYMARPRFRNKVGAYLDDLD
jgi:hypothetical protein